MTRVVERGKQPGREIMRQSNAVLTHPASVPAQPGLPPKGGHPCKPSRIPSSKRLLRMGRAGVLIRHPISARGHDLYETPGTATLSLLAVDRCRRRSWSRPAGAVPSARCCAAPVTPFIENDIFDYGQGQHNVQDFLNFKPAQADEIDAIVTNPPPAGAAFVRHALTLCPRVFMLLRLTFLESERRRDVLEDCRTYPHSRVPQPPTDDAPRRLGWESRFKSDGVRLVRLGARLYRQTRN